MVSAKAIELLQLAEFARLCGATVTVQLLGGLLAESTDAASRHGLGNSLAEPMSVGEGMEEESCLTAAALTRKSQSKAVVSLKLVEGEIEGLADVLLPASSPSLLLAGLGLGFRAPLEGLAAPKSLKDRSSASRRASVPRFGKSEMRPTGPLMPGTDRLRCLS